MGLRRLLDVAGADHIRFFTCEPKSYNFRRERKRPIVVDADPKELGPPLVTQNVGTQTDFRDSEIQTDPLWFRAEGLEMLCYRGCYRKLERAKLLARFRDEKFTLLQDSNAGRVETDADVNKRDVGCWIGPSSESRPCMPDPVDCWVSTYRLLQRENEFISDRIDQKKDTLENQQSKRPPVHFELRLKRPFNSKVRTPGHAAVRAWDASRQLFAGRKKEINSRLDILCQEIVRQQLI